LARDTHTSPRVMLALAIVVTSAVSATSAVAARVGNESKPSSKMDFKWLADLDTPQSAAIQSVANLQERADKKVASLGAGIVETLGEIDVVVSGGGNFDGYYAGVHMLLSRLESASGTFKRTRFAGVSAGGMMPFEFVLKGENLTLAHHADYGLLQEQHPIWLDPGALSSAARQDHHWRLLSDWQAHRFAMSLSRLNGVVVVGTSCLDPLPKLLLVDQYTSVEQAASAFMATGTAFELYQGKLCSDGGATSGKRMTPLFQDGLRPQLAVSILPDDHEDFPFDTVSKYNLTMFEALVRKGQDDAEAWLKCGPTKQECATKQLALCPRGKATSAHVCGT